MAELDKYLTVDIESIGEFKDQGSKFIAYLFPIRSTEDFSYKMELLKKEHSKASHHCFAYRFGLDQEEYRHNDDGEPSGTAGKPIYGQLIKHGLINIGCISIRYYGGTNLGTSGLINAYRESALAAIKEAKIVEKVKTAQIELKFDYSLMGTLMNSLKQMKINIVEKNLAETASIIIEIPKSEIPQHLVQLKAKMLGISQDRIDEKTEVGGLKISAPQA